MFPRGFSVSGLMFFVSGGVSVQGVSVWEVSVQGSLSRGGLCPGGLCPGVSVCPIDPTDRDPPYGNEHPTGMLSCSWIYFNTKSSNIKENCL